MAYVVSYVTARTDGTTTASLSFVDWITGQVDDDYIVIVAINDGGGTAIGGMSGWTEIYLDAASVSGTRTGIWYRKRSGSDLTAPTITGANDDWAAHAILIRDADATTFLDVAAGVTSQSASTVEPVCPTVTPSNTDTLILRIVARDGNNNPQPAIPTAITLVATTVDTIASSTSLALAVYCSVSRAASAVGTVTFYDTASDGGAQATIAIRNKSGGKVPAFIHSSPMTNVLRLNTAGTTALLSTYHASPATLLGRVCALGDTTGGAVRNSVSAVSTTYYPRGNLAYTREFGQTQTATTGVAATYGAAWTVSAVNLQDSLFYTNVFGVTPNAAIDNIGQMLYFRDSSGEYALWSPFTEVLLNAIRPVVAHLPSETMYEESGAIDWTDITQIGVAIPVNATTGSNANRSLTFMDGIYIIPFTSGTSQPVIVCGGSLAVPITAREAAGLFKTQANLWTYYQGAKQVSTSIAIQIGNGGTPAVHFSGDAGATEFTDPGLLGVILPEDTVEYRVKLGASDSFKMAAQAIGSVTRQKFIVDSSSSTSATYDWRGTLFNMACTFIDGLTVAGLSLAGCSEIDAQAAVFDDCSITGTTSTDAAIAFDANSSMTGTTIDVTGTSAAYHLELGTAVTAFTITDCTFTGTPGTDKIHVKATTGTVTITTSGSSLVAGDITSDGATVSLVSPTDDLTVTSTESNTLLQVFTTGTQTVLASTTGTTLTYTHSLETVDIVAQKAGFIPQRVTGIALAGDITRAFTMVPDYNYNASHGLTYTTDASWSRTNNQLTVPSWAATRTVRNVYSLMIDAFIAETTLRNTAFNLSMNGPTSLFLIEGAEGASDASITNMVAGGVRYLSASEVTTAEFVGVQSQGVTAGLQPEYEQVDAGTVTNTRATGDVNQIIKMYGDASHGNFNYRGVLYFKVQANGYRQAEVDVLTSFGIATLEPTLYIISLTTTAITGLTIGDPSASNLTITDDSAAPVSWDAGDGAKNYSLTITDAAANSGETILRWLNYNLSLDATFQSKDPFYWPEMVIDNGAAYETLRGTLHKAGGDVTAGVRVIRTGGDPHPDFTRFQADDGTYGTPPVLASIAISSIPNAGAVPTRLQIINATAAIAAVWQASTAYADNAVRLRTTGVGTENTAGLYFRVTTAGTSAASEPTWNTTPGGTTTDGTVTWTTYSVLFYDADPAATSYSTTYTDGNQFLAGETVTVRFAEMDGSTSFKTFSGNVVAASTGFSVQVDEDTDEVYATNALDGSAYEATFTPNYVNDRLELDSNTDFSGKSAYAYFCYLLTSTNGMYEFWGGMTGIDTGNYRIESDVLNMYFDETSGFVKQTDSVRIFRKDETRPALDPTTGGNGIEINWRVPVNVVTVAGASVITGDIAQILTPLGEVQDLIEADEIHTGTTVEKKLRGTSTVLLTKNWTGTPLSTFEAVDP